MAGERNADEIQRDIEQSRVALATAVDQLVDRTNPKRLVEQAKQRIKDRVKSPQGQRAIRVAGGVAVLLIIRRVAKRRRSTGEPLSEPRSY